MIPDLRLKIANCEFSNPCLTASGTYGWGDKFISVLNKIGGFITKGITLTPREGNPPPRIWEVPGGIVNAIGLENPGAVYFANHILPNLSKLQTKIIVNILGTSVEEFETLVKILDRPEVSGFELNLSCPNVKEGGLSFSLSPRNLAKVVSAVRKQTKKLLICKLSAGITDLLTIAQVCEKEGADALTLLNSLPAFVISSETFKSCLGSPNGGLSGPALKPFVLFCLHKVREVVSLPLIACGGITNYHDALESLIVGASLFQVGSINLINPFAPIEILEGLKRFLKEKGIPSVRSLIGKLESPEG